MNMHVNAREAIETANQNGEIIIPEYRKVEKALAELRSRYANTTFDVTTTKGMQEAKKARQEVRGYRTSLEAKRKELKAPALAYGKALDTEAKRITAELEALETPIDTQIKEEEARKAAEKAEAERQERARIDAHRERIESIRNLPLQLIGASADRIERAMDDLMANTLEGLEEFTSEAAIVRDEASAKLFDMLSLAKANEESNARLEAEKAEREAREKAEAEKRAKEQAELEELRRFKAEQEAAKAREEKEAAMRVHQFEAEQKAAQQNAEAVQAASEVEASVPVEETVEVSAAIEQHSKNISNRDEAISDLRAFGLDADDAEALAEALVDAIIDGEIRNVSFNGTI